MSSGKLRSFAPGDIVEISFLHMPVAKKMGDMAQFSCRIRAISPVGEYVPTNPAICPPDNIDRRGWQVLHWEQRSAGKSGMITVPAEGQNIRTLPRVRFIKRPR